MKATRIFQLTVLTLLAVSVVQVCYWLFDLRATTLAKLNQVHALYSQQLSAGRALLGAGVPAAEVQRLLPDLVVDGGRLELSPAVGTALAADQSRHITQYLSEGAFFLLALCACIAVIWRALRAVTRPPTSCISRFTM